MDIKAIASSLIMAVGVGNAVFMTDIESAARDTAKNWGRAYSQSIADDIAQEIRKRGNPVSSSK